MNIDEIRKYCLSLQAATEDIKWDNDLCFSVGAKMFCVGSLESPFKVAFKVADEDFEELSAKDGFIPAPYMARAKWVLVTKPSKLGKKDWERYIKNSYDLVKAKLTAKLRKELGLDK
ncbi:MAG TPA: MmcQ/YjbR family DNA-binding protein [Chitinophagaceae bacterium]